MPHIAPSAKEYELRLAEEFAWALRSRRRALGITASELARRTESLGYPITRGAITKMETNARAGKIDVAELLVLSAALDIPPVLLLFPRFPEDGETVVLPNVGAKGRDAAAWVSGFAELPTSDDPEQSGEGRTPPPNDGITLITADRQALEAVLEFLVARRRGSADAPGGDEKAIAERAVEVALARWERAEDQAKEALESLWDSMTREEKSAEAIVPARAKPKPMPDQTRRHA
ncbi:helix-turn-helix domain-containing protein [Mycolicibacterium hippocampi]|uniref:helix-turn-helix domain-containing protein n=1 Tax=Mycolicibacterium hippocampi TaxID=659824 RepID=UPI0035125839